MHLACGIYSFEIVATNETADSLRALDLKPDFLQVH